LDEGQNGKRVRIIKINKTSQKRKNMALKREK